MTLQREVGGGCLNPETPAMKTGALKSLAEPEKTLHLHLKQRG